VHRCCNDEIGYREHVTAIYVGALRFLVIVVAGLLHVADMCIDFTDDL